MPPRAKSKSRAKAKARAPMETEAQAGELPGLPATGAAAEEKAEEKVEGEDGDEEEIKETKKWVKIYGPNGDESKLLLSMKQDTKTLRRNLCRQNGLPSMELVLEVNGKELVEAHAHPLKNFNPEKGSIRWYRGDRLQRLLDKRQLPTINNLDKFERTAIHFAVIDGDFELTEMIVDHKAFKFPLINKQDVFGDTALHLACILGYDDVVELLLDKQSEPELKNIYMRTPTMLAAEHGHGLAMRALLRNGAKLGPNAGKYDWKYPTVQWLAKHNFRNKALREIEHHRVEQEVLAELEAGFPD